MDVFNNIIGWVGDRINELLSFICLILPDSPFQLLNYSPISQYLGYINYFIPIDFMLDAFITWLSAISLYYGYQIVMRWAKAIE